MKKRSLLALPLFALPFLLLIPATAQAETIPAQFCSTGWYVNGDEALLMPEQKPEGLLFDGPSLIHHVIGTPASLATTPTDGAFTTIGAGVGSKPLFKMETNAPYSTLNKTAAGKWWSSKLAADAPGGQSMPLDDLSSFVGKGSYTSDTMVYSFGVGYANDTDKTATVTSISFAGHKYALDCASPSPSVSGSASTSASTSASGAVLPSTSGSAKVPTLPVTGFPTGYAIGLAVVLLTAGGVLFIAFRRHRIRFEA